MITQDGTMAMELIGRGRDADVYAIDGRRVLRRYKNDGPVEREARLMGHLRAAGYPVPLVYEASGTDIVMQRLHGPTMMEESFRTGDTLGDQLAELHNRLHALAAPDWLPRHRLGGDRIIHLDLHPANVILTADGPVVIDWTNAAAGDPALDVADLVVLMRSVKLDDVDLDVFDPLREKLIEDFLAHVDADPGPRLAEAVTARLHNANVLPAEAEDLRAWLKRLS